MRNSRKNRRIKAFKSYMQAFQVLRPEHTQIVNGGGCVGHYPCRETSGVGPARRADRRWDPSVKRVNGWIEQSLTIDKGMLPA